MPTFIDESGDTGPADGGGSTYFRLAAVWMPTRDEAEAFRETVRKLRQRRNLTAGFEFKFVSTHGHPQRRREFFAAALKRDFRFTVCSIDKTADDWKSVSGSDLHWACATSLSVELQSIYLEAEKTQGVPLREPIVVDDNSDHEFLATIKRAFRGLKSHAKPGSSLIGPVSFRKSKADEMLQLADMICGAVGSHLDQSDSTWYNMISDRNLRTFCLP